MGLPSNNLFGKPQIVQQPFLAAKPGFALFCSQGFPAAVAFERIQEFDRRVIAHVGFHGQFCDRERLVPARVNTPFSPHVDLPYSAFPVSAQFSRHISLKIGKQERPVRSISVLVQHTVFRQDESALPTDVFPVLQKQLLTDFSNQTGQGTEAIA